jgi:hypothetical protein
MRNLILAVCAVSTVVPATAQVKSGKFAVFVSGIGNATPVAESLINKMNASKPFEAVSGKNDSSKVAVLISCMDRKQGDPFACLYVSHHNGATFKSFLGAGMYIAKTADEVSDNFLVAIAQDIVERFNDTSTQNLREGLESCLLMTESKCNVPDPLQKELGAKELTLGQYLMKKNQ